MITRGQQNYLFFYYLFCFIVVFLKSRINKMTYKGNKTNYVMYKDHSLPLEVHKTNTANLTKQSGDAEKIAAVTR